MKMMVIPAIAALALSLSVASASASAEETAPAQEPTVGCGVDVHSGNGALENRVHPKEGGEWYYGWNVFFLWSHYYHKSRCHGASVKRGTRINRTVDIAPGNWAKASLKGNAGGGEYFYRVC